jgi:hypothetical protein
MRAMLDLGVGLRLLGMLRLTVGGLLVLAVGCGGEQKQPEIPPPPPPQGEEASDPDWDTGDAPPASDESDEANKPAADAPPAELKEPEFKPGMSVNEAIAAVPSHYEFVGIEQEVLAKPLQNLDTFKECKLTQNDHFKLKLAVWDGRVVGADVTAQPAKKECIDRVVRTIEYKEKEKSINTVEFDF